MTTTTISAEIGQQTDKQPMHSYVRPQDHHEAISQAIQNREVISLEYQGNPRNIIPLVYGELKNGRQAVLCYKIVASEDGGAELFLRLYHIEKIRHLHRTSLVSEVKRKIDYYLTKHFASVFQKV